MSCPICGEDAVKAYRPFCSDRCANRDLAHWLRGDYAFASSRLEEADDAAAAMDEIQKKPH
ncbi:MAG: DNA gyrase inhibitor YacG [Pseudomonadota bacterium]